MRRSFYLYDPERPCVRLGDMTTMDTVRPTYLTTEDIAARYGVNEDTARRWIRQKRLPAIRIGGAYRVRLDDLLRLERTTGIPASESSDGQPVFDEPF